MIRYLVNVFVDGGYQDYSIFSVLSLVLASGVFVVVIVSSICGVADATDVILVVYEARTW